MADASDVNGNRFEVVRAWHEAVNRGDADALVALCDNDVEIGGPRGSAHSRAVLRDWLGRAGIRLDHRRWFSSPTEVVVEQVATWRGPDGAVTDPEFVASSFTVENALVKRMIRYGTLLEALDATGLTLRDELPASER
jgi:ketosteroid isomerase-like protein